MSKTLIWSIVGVVVIVGGVFMFSKSDKEITNSNPAAGKKMAFSEFVKGSGSYKCTVNQSVEGTDTKGTVYITKGLLRGEFSSQVRGMNVDTTFIVKEGYTYTWTSLMPKFGFKTKIPEKTEGDTSTQTSGSYSFNAEKIGDYDCTAWTLDPSKFIVPSTVTFSEMPVK